MSSSHRKTVLITGCSSGIGKTTARLFADRGWNVIATLRKPEALASEVWPENVLFARLDVQDQASIEAAIAAGVARFGRIDTVINNAGYGLFGLFESTATEKIQEQFDVNVFGVMNVIRAVLPQLRAQGSGTLVNISSGAGVVGLPMVSLYNASKFALEGFSESLSYELASQNIVVKIIEPGGVLSTSFGQRTSQEAATTDVPAHYQGFVEHAGEFFAGMASRAHATEDDVAEVVYRAATDGTSQLRYLATDDIAPMVKARRETSEKEYMDFMRKGFGYSPKAS